MHPNTNMYTCAPCNKGECVCVCVCGGGGGGGGGDQGMNNITTIQPQPTTVD